MRRVTKKENATKTLYECPSCHNREEFTRIVGGAWWQYSDDPDDEPDEKEFGDWEEHIKDGEIVYIEVEERYEGEDDEHATWGEVDERHAVESIFCSKCGEQGNESNFMEKVEVIEDDV